MSDEGHTRLHNFPKESQKLLYITHPSYLALHYTQIQNKIYIAMQRNNKKIRGEKRNQLLK